MIKKALETLVPTIKRFKFFLRDNKSWTHIVVETDNVESFMTQCNRSGWVQVSNREFVPWHEVTSIEEMS